MQWKYSITDINKQLYKINYIGDKYTTAVACENIVTVQVHVLLMHLSMASPTPPAPGWMGK